MSAPTAVTTDGLIYAPQHGFRAPEFTIQTMAGETISLVDLRGQVILINFWASWCPPCRAEMPTMEEMYQEYQERGFTILAINSTIQDNQSDASEFVRQFGLTYPIPLDITGDITNLYMIKALPTSFFVDREGVIQEIIIGGPMLEALLRERIEKYLGEQQ